MAQSRDASPVGVWSGGIVGGLLGGIGMGIVLHLGANQTHLFRAFVDRPTVLAGWAVHLAFSVLFGMAFAAVVSSRSVDEFVAGRADELAGFTTSVLFGLTFGAILGLVAGGLLLPLSLSRVSVTAYPAPVLPLPGFASEQLFASLLAVAHSSTASEAESTRRSTGTRRRASPIGCPHSDDRRVLESTSERRD